MAWPLVFGFITCCLLFSNSLVRLYEQNASAQAWADDALLRQLWAILRVLENSPGGLISTELKLVICRFLANSFRRLHARHGSGAGYLPCIEAADSQVNTLNQRATGAPLPNFDDEPRIRAAQHALPGVRRVVKQLCAYKAVSAAEAKKFMQQLDQRSLELAADKYVLCARKAEQENDGTTALRYYQSAQRALHKASGSETPQGRLPMLEGCINKLQNK
ncbi:MAG: hypothetical protein ACR2P1_02685 [Pseudomonadales bacterium]